MGYKEAPLPVDAGGTGRQTLTNHGVLVGAGTSPVTQLAAGSTGQVLQSGGAGGDPSYSTATYPSTATGTGKILRADGTNWSATTATYPDTAGTSGNVLTSDGTNWTSTAPAGSSILVATKNITSAQVKALRATPITLVSTPGSGKMISFIAAFNRLNYGGNNAFTNAQSCSIKYKDATGTQITGGALAAAFLTATANSITPAIVITTPGPSVTADFVNQPLVLCNNGASEITGNAAGDNTIDFWVYYIVTTV